MNALHDSMMSIGEFAHLCRVTVKTLRHYEKVGVLMPDMVDEASGYRYYTACQMQCMNTIAALKYAGFTLEEIAELLANSGGEPASEALNAKIAECEAELARLHKRRDVLQRWLEVSRRRRDVVSHRVELASLPGMTVAVYRRRVTALTDLLTLCPQQIGPAMMRAGCECSLPGYCFATELLSDDADGVAGYEYSEQVVAAAKETALITYRHLPAEPMALTLACPGGYDELPAMMQSLCEYARSNGYVATAPGRYNFVDGVWNKESPDEWLTVLQLPVRRVTTQG